MTTNLVHITVSPEIKKMLVVDCKRLYLKHHPEMKEVYISEKKMAYEVFKFYLEA